MNKVSIIIPVFNRENLILETLNSIYNQVFKSWECVLVDDHSTDATFSVIKEYIKDKPNFKLFKRPDEYLKGANGCRNYGFKKSNGEYINWFDSDDIMHENFLKEKVENIKENDCIISKTIFFKDNINTIVGKETRTHNSKKLLEEFITLKISWYLPDPMWKKSFLEDKKLFSETLLKGQDRDFHIRMLLQNPKISFLDEYLTYYRQHTSTISSNNSPKVMLTYFKSIKDRIQLLSKNKMSDELKQFLLKTQVKNYPFVYKQKKINTYYFRLFYKLFTFSFFNFKIMIKFIFAYISFKLFDKGSVFLKG